MNLNCFVIEDERPAQRVLEKYIGDVPSLQLSGMCTGPVEAVARLKKSPVDIIFLDINLPKMSGLTFLRSLPNPPHIIITTAYPDYAPEGFDLNVVDYLLKPFSFDRFLQAVSKVSAAPKNNAAEPTQSFVFVKVDKSLQKVDFNAIKYIESDRDYVSVVMNERRFSHIQTLKYWVELLPDARFAQIHKSFIVNIAAVQKIIGNQLEIGDQVLPIGRHYKHDFMDKIDTVS